MIDSKILMKSDTLLQVHGPKCDRMLSISTDSRSCTKEDVFIALRGLNHDGFNFVDRPLEAGCPIVVFESGKENQKRLIHLKEHHPETCFIEVSDSIGFLQDIAGLRALDFIDSGGKVVGITGSNGKTTHKEMLYCLLHEAFGDKVLATRGNLNNHIGVPLTLLKLENKHEIAIIEMGTNHPGEIGRLCEMASPSCGLITNIGASHLEFFGDEKNVFLEKRALFDSVENKGVGVFVVPGDDEYLNQLEGETLFKFYREDESKENFYKKTGCRLELSTSGGSIEFENIGLGGEYNFSNMAACLLLALKMFPKEKSKFLESASNYKAPEINRSNWIKKNKRKIFLDAYNANPSSMKVSLEYFESFLEEADVKKGQAALILGDMNELGPKTEEYHREIGKWLSGHGFQNVAFIGRYSSFYLSGQPDGFGFATVEEFRENCPPFINTSKLLFLKGSRSLQLESLLDIF